MKSVKDTLNIKVKEKERQTKVHQMNRKKICMASSNSKLKQIKSNIEVTTRKITELQDLITAA